MTTGKGNRTLVTAIAVPASHLEKELERQDIVDGSFDATTKRGALRLLRAALSAERHEKTAT